MDIISVQLGIVDFGQEKGIRIFHFDVGIQIAPKFHGYHLGHIKPEPVYTKIQPILGNVLKLVPRIGQGLILPKFVMFLILFLTVFFGKFLKIFGSVRTHAIIDFYSFVPIIKMGPGQARAISGPFGRNLFKFGIGQPMCITAQWQVPILPFGHLESFSGDIVKIVVFIVGFGGIVRSTKIFHTFGIGQPFVVSGYMVGHNIDNHFHPRIVRTLNQRLELFQSF